MGSRSSQSYNRSADRTRVQGITEALQAQGLRLWRFEEQVAPGEVLEQAIAQGIAQAKTLVVFIGSQGLGPWQEQELLRAHQADTQRIIPVLLLGVELLSESRSLCLPPCAIALCYTCMGNPMMQTSLSA